MPVPTSKIKSGGPHTKLDAVLTHSLNDCPIQSIPFPRKIVYTPIFSEYLEQCKSIVLKQLRIFSSVYKQRDELNRLAVIQAFLVVKALSNQMYPGRNRARPDETDDNG